MNGGIFLLLATAGVVAATVNLIKHDYSLRSDGKVRVVNRCRKSSGDYTTATGSAKVIDKTTNAKLK